MSDLLAARCQMAMSLAFHIIFAVVGIGMPLLMVIAERRWLRTGDADLPRAGQALGQGHRDPVRRRRRVGHGAVVRARPALARASWSSPARSSACRSRSRASPSSPRRSSSGIYLYGWDRDLAAARTSRPASSWRVSGAALGHLRRDRQRVDERAGRLRHRRTASVGRHRSDRGDAEPGRVPADAAHDAGRVRRHRLRGRRASTPSCCCATRRTPFHRRALGDRARWSARRPRCCSRSRATSAPGRSRATSRSSSPRWRRTSRPSAARRCASAAGPTWTPARRATRSRSRTGSRCSPSTIPTPRCKGLERRSRARTGRRRRSSTSPFRSWWRWARYMALVALWAAVAGAARRGTRAANRLAAAGARAGGAAGLHRHRGRLDGDRGGPAAVDHLRRAAHRRRGDADAGPGRAVPRCSRCSTASSA